MTTYDVSTLPGGNDYYASLKQSLNEIILEAKMTLHPGNLETLTFIRHFLVPIHVTSFPRSICISDKRKKKINSAKVVRKLNWRAAVAY